MTLHRPPGYTAVTPWIIGPDTAGLIDWLTRAFDAKQTARVENGDGRIGHAEMRIGDAMVMMFDARPEWPPTPAFLRLYVEDADAAVTKALAAGGTLVTPVTHLAFGDRVGRVRDPFGNLYWLQTRVENLSAAEVRLRWDDPSWAGAMARVERFEIVEKDPIGRS